jgi:hypothetical protein
MYHKRCVANTAQPAALHLTAKSLNKFFWQSTVHNTKKHAALITVKDLQLSMQSIMLKQAP